MNEKKWQHKVKRCFTDRNSEMNDVGGGGVWIT